VKEQDPERFKTSWRSLVENNQLFEAANSSLREAVHKGDAIAKIQAVVSNLRKAGETGRSVPTEAEIQNAFSFLVNT